MNLIKNKKAGAVPSTIVWIGALVVIIFLMLLFLLSVTLLSVEKKIKFWSDDLIGKKELNQPGVSIATSTLPTLMNLETEFQGEKMKIKEILKKWPEVFENDEENKKIKDKIEEKLKFLLKDTDKSYIFHAELEIAQQERERLAAEQNKKMQSATATAAGGAIKPSKDLLKAELEFYDLKTSDCFANKDLILNQAPKIYLPTDQEKIEVNLFIGQC